MTPTQKAAMQAALAFIQDIDRDDNDRDILSQPQCLALDASRNALRAALAEPAVDPVAWRAKDANGRWMYGNLPAPELPADAPQLLFASLQPPADHSCKFPLCQTEAYQQMLAVQVAKDLFEIPAEVPLLSDDEAYTIYEQAMQGYFTDAKHHWSTGRASVFARAVEQAVRQKAGLA